MSLGCWGAYLHCYRTSAAHSFRCVRKSILPVMKASPWADIPIPAFLSQAEALPFPSSEEPASPPQSLSDAGLDELTSELFNIWTGNEKLCQPRWG